VDVIAGIARARGTQLRTADAGVSWTQAHAAGGELGIAHGAQSIFYTTDGVLYAATGEAIARSTDNGASWESLGDTCCGQYRAIGGDGQYLFARTINWEGDQNVRYMISTDGTRWEEDTRSTGTVHGAPNRIVFDPVNEMLYADSSAFGVFARRRGD
jgi:hypothetical protein